MKKPPINKPQVSSEELEFALEKHPIPVIVERFKKLAKKSFMEEIDAKNPALSGWNVTGARNDIGARKALEDLLEESDDLFFIADRILYSKGSSHKIDMLCNVLLTANAVTSKMTSGDIEGTAHSVFLLTACAMQADLFVDYLKEIELEEQAGKIGEQGIKLEKKEHAIKKMLPDAKRGKKVKKGAAAGGLGTKEAAEEDTTWYMTRAEQKITERGKTRLPPYKISELARILEIDGKKSTDVTPLKRRTIRRKISPLFNRK